MGRVHSIESLGTLDGPGVRTVIFMQGCMLACGFCHNPDAIPLEYGKNYTPVQLFKIIEKHKQYWGDNGGITITGGEPMHQTEFLNDFLTICKKKNIHTVVDSSLWCPRENVEELLPLVDLWMVSIKHPDDRRHRKIVGQSSKTVIENLEIINSSGGNIRLRFVIIPGLTDDKQSLLGLKNIAKKIRKLEAVELLAFNKLGQEKGKAWEWEKYREATIDDLILAKRLLVDSENKLKIII